MKICDGSVRSDLCATHKEADVTIAQQVIHLANSSKNRRRVLSNDTEVFVLPLYNTEHYGTFFNILSKYIPKCIVWLRFDSFLMQKTCVI